MLFQAQLLLDVLETEGEDALMAHRIPLLTWRQSEDLKAAYRIEGPPGGHSNLALLALTESRTSLLTNKCSGHSCEAPCDCSSLQYKCVRIGDSFLDFSA